MAHVNNLKYLLKLFYGFDGCGLVVKYWPDDQS